ncbi:MAG: cysteine hydrolase [Candidatus Rokubacteria bacterium]|nr:cysteine hydrolase [Candidatus Rokubacteria bacterium]
MDRNQTFERVLRLPHGRTALLVIDMQRGFLDPGEAMEVPPAREIVPRIQALVTLFREKRLPVVFTEFLYSERVPLLVGELHPEHKRALPGNPRGFGMPSSSCLEGEASVHTVSDLAPRPDELVIRKHWYDAFNGTVLDGALRARGVTSLVLTGTMTDICVLASVVGAFNREYRLVVVEDAVATLCPEIQRATLDIFRRAFARVVSAKEVADEIALW